MSQYPAMGPSGYDRALLTQAPAISRQDRQEGYSVDLLQEHPNSDGRRSRTPSPTSFPSPPLTRPAGTVPPTHPPGYYSNVGEPNFMPVQAPSQNYNNPGALPPNWNAGPPPNPNQVNQNPNPFGTPIYNNYNSSVTGYAQSDRASSMMEKGGAVGAAAAIPALRSFTPPPRPFFRSRQGKLLLIGGALLIFAIIGAVVGAILVANSKSRARGGRSESGSGGVSSTRGLGIPNTSTGLPLTELQTPEFAPIDTSNFTFTFAPRTTAGTPRTTGAPGVQGDADEENDAGDLVLDTATRAVPTRVTQTRATTSAPTATPTRDPICLRFPSIPSCLED